MARRSARILEKELAEARKHQVSGPNLLHLFSGNGNSLLEQFPLMELPREVRDMIYEACLAFDGAIFVKDKRKGPRSIQTNRSSPFKHRQREGDLDRGMASIESSATAQGRKLFYVSKQIHDEAVSVFYRKNTFEFTSLTEMEKFIRNMGLRNQHSLRSVIVYYQAAYMEYARPLTLLTQCVGLRNLTLVLCDDCMAYTNKYIATDGYTYGWAELKVPRAFGTLLRIRGLDNVRLVSSPRAGYLASPSHRGFEMLAAMEDAIQVTKKPGPVPKTPKRRKAKKRAQKKRKSAST